MPLKNFPEIDFEGQISYTKEIILKITNTENVKLVYFPQEGFYWATPGPNTKMLNSKTGVEMSKELAEKLKDDYKTTLSFAKIERPVLYPTTKSITNNDEGAVFRDNGVNTDPITMAEDVLETLPYIWDSDVDNHDDDVYDASDVNDILGDNEAVHYFGHSSDSGISINGDNYGYTDIDDDRNTRVFVVQGCHAGGTFADWLVSSSDGNIMCVIGATGWIYDWYDDCEDWSEAYWESLESGYSGSGAKSYANALTYWCQLNTDKGSCSSAYI